MSQDSFQVELKKNWDLLYNEDVLKRKFLRTLKQTRSTLAGIWSYGSNLQYHNMVYEGERPKRFIEDIFGLDDQHKDLLKSSPFR
jgi:hypothetical protein